MAEKNHKHYYGCFCCAFMKGGFFVFTTKIKRSMKEGNIMNQKLENIEDLKKLRTYNDVGNWNFSDLNYETEYVDYWDMYEELTKHVDKSSVVLDLGTGGGERALASIPDVALLVGTDANGKSVIKDYIKSLQMKNNKDSNIKFNKIVAYMRMLKEYGVALGQPYVKHIEGEIWELRPLRDRILFTYCKGNDLILLNIFVKQTQKTPQVEIDKAKRLLEDYKRRRGFYE